MDDIFAEKILRLFERLVKAVESIAESLTEEEGDELP